MSIKTVDINQPPSLGKLLARVEVVFEKIGRSMMGKNWLKS